MPNVIWTRAAVEDLIRLFNVLKEESPDAAQNAALHIRKAADSLMISARIGNPMNDDPGKREFATGFGKNGYILRYIVDNDQVVIIRVWHYLEKRSS